MNKKIFLVLLTTILMVSYMHGQPQQGQQRRPESEATYHGPFIENFTKQTSEFFNYNIRRTGYDFRYYSGIPSLSERGTDIMMYRLDPEDPAGAGRGPEIISKEYTYYGTYAARIRVPDVTKVQPNLGAVVGYFTYNVDSVLGQSEIDYEWLIADPEIIYIGTWTGVRPAHNRVGRTINLAKGIIYSTSYRGESRGAEGSTEVQARGQFTGEQNQPETITPIKNYNASARFYTYGFDWFPDRLTWWIINPDTNEKIILWDYKGKTVFPGQPAPTGIPAAHSRYRLNYWHTNNWPVETNPNSIEAPRYPYELEIDWMLYRPFEDLNPNLAPRQGQQRRTTSAGN
jgi:hypothetical protein